jgi:hypothetical protein
MDEQVFPKVVASEGLQQGVESGATSAAESHSLVATGTASKEVSFPPDKCSSSLETDIQRNK